MGKGVMDWDSSWMQPFSTGEREKGNCDGVLGWPHLPIRGWTSISLYTEFPSSHHSHENSQSITNSWPCDLTLNASHPITSLPSHLFSWFFTIMHFSFVTHFWLQFWKMFLFKKTLHCVLYFAYLLKSKWSMLLPFALHRDRTKTHLQASLSWALNDGSYFFQSVSNRKTNVIINALKLNPNKGSSEEYSCSHLKKKGLLCL